MISDFTERIEIKRIAIGYDFGFEPSETTETSILTTWANIKEVKRSSAVQQQLDVENDNYKMTIRYVSGRDVRKDDVIVWNSERYRAITSSSVNEIGKKKFLETLIVRQHG